MDAFDIDRNNPVVIANLPTIDGPVKIYAYQTNTTEPALAIVYGDLTKLKQDSVWVRIHSECLTGDVFRSLRCDCGEQLQQTQRQFSQTGGVIIYLRQEGRGIGLREKLKAYNLQDAGLDTYDANLALGHSADKRCYDDAVAILSDLGIKSVKLLTNNQGKVDVLRNHGIEVVMINMKPEIVTNQILKYLTTKVERMAHTLDLKQLIVNAS